MFTRYLIVVAAILLGVVFSTAGYCIDSQVEVICDSTGCHTVVVITYEDGDL